MDDRQLLKLISMANEIDQLERDSSAPVVRTTQVTHASEGRPAPRLIGHGPARPAVHVTRLRIGLAATLAAAVALAWFLLPTPTSTPPAPQGVKLTDRNPAQLKPGTRTVTTDGTPCVVLAIFRDSTGTQQCVDMSIHEIDAHDGLHQADARKLLASAASKACMDRPDRLLIVAVAGPLEKLPGTSEDVSRLATCVTDSSRTCDEDLSSYERAAKACLPNGLTVVADQLSL
ncbi:MAG TPA: hypothetical protein VG797_09805 [Phycisphaerales bacterium]|nr:hypothetical protein [Phycisphaerales bacterium]